MPALLPGTVCRTIFSPSQTLKDISQKLPVYIVISNSFIVCRNMKCPPFYFVGEAIYDDEHEV